MKNHEEASHDAVNLQSETLLSRLSKYFIEHTSMTYLLILTLLIMGISSVFLLPKESLPEIVFPTLTIQTAYPGASALDVEQLLTDPIETKIGSIADLDELSSQSSEGYSYIIMTFVEGVDIQKKSLEVESLLNNVTYPEGSLKPEVEIFKTSEIPLLTFSVEGPYSLATLSTIAEDIADDVQKLAAVDHVSLSGDVGREIHIVIDKLALHGLGISMGDLATAIQSSSLNVPLGQAETGGQISNVSLENRAETLEDLKKIIISTQSGQALYLGDIADIHEDTQKQTLLNRTYFKGYASQNTAESVYVYVYRKVNTDVVGTSQQVVAKLEAMRGITYPKDVTARIVYNSANDVKRDLSNIQLSAYSGLLVVIMVLFLFIGFKESLIVAITMPLSLLLTLSALRYFDISLNAFAILGLIVALGLLVDNSIIVMENMDRLYKMGYKPFDAALEGVAQVALPITASTFTTVAAFFPLAILPGILGAFVNTIPRTIILALLASLLMSITVTPSIYYVMLKRTKKTLPKRTRLMRWVEILGMMGLSFIAFYDREASLWLPLIAMAFFGSLMFFKHGGIGSDSSSLVIHYETFLRYILGRTSRKITVILVGFAILIGTGTLIPLGVLKVNFFPNSEPSRLIVTVDTPGGMTLNRTQEVVSSVEAILIADPDVKVFNSAIGGNAEADTATLDVSLYDKGERSSSGFEVLERLNAAFSNIPDAKIEIDSVSQGGPPSSKAISIELNADDYEAGKRVADQYLQILNQIDGVYNVSTNVADSGPKTRVVVDPIKAFQYGLTPAGVASQLQADLNGRVATTLKENQELVDVRLLYESYHNTSAMMLSRETLETPNGTMIPLTEVAAVQLTQGIGKISHLNGDRIITVEADVREGYTASDINAEFEAEADNVELPNGVKVNITGELQDIQDSFKDLLQSMVLAILLVFVILTLQFKSLRQPFAILTTVPMALIGVFGGLVLTGNEFGFYAFMGLISLVGIAVNDAIVLIDFMNSSRREGQTIEDAIVSAGKIRFQPVLATTLTTIGGILPLAFREVYYAQFSYTLVFGLLVTTVMTLVIIPTAYHLLEKSTEMR